MATVAEKPLGGIATFEKLETSFSILYKTGEYARLNILNNHVFQYYMSPTGQFLDYPTPINASDKINIKSVEDYGSHAFDLSTLIQTEQHYIVQTNKLQILFDKVSGTFAVHDIITDQGVLKEQKPIHYSDTRSKQVLCQCEDEYFFGGGMHNGKFTHKGEIIVIDYTENSLDGRASCPTPLYWSTKGYGVMRNTWKKGSYNFGSANQQIIETDHEESHFDAFYFINPLPKDILNDYYELTGRPIFMPEYAFYEAHINTFTEMYWYECDYDNLCAVVSDEGKYYEPDHAPTMCDKKGIVGSLNGVKSQYELSARHMIDWYNDHDMPLGWFVPNNESGYGETDALECDLNNLKTFVEYANKNGVEVALWTDRCLEPKTPEKRKRDLKKEIDVGVVAFKCDEFNNIFNHDAVEKVTKIFESTSQDNVRPFMMMVDGWAGTQRLAGIWSGEQTGGVWEYIRFHIPAFIGAGLSGLPIVGSVMDGAYGGGNSEVNIREFQWKTFTPIQLNLDGWGKVLKVPFGQTLELIMLNRASLKLKSMLQPYNYTICRESIQGLPMIRAMFLEFPKERSAYTKDSQYQYMWGPNLLVAPVYANADNIRPKFRTSHYCWEMDDLYSTKAQYDSISLRNEVYLPDHNQVWIDLFTGDRYQGGKIYNNIKTPLWKIPVLVKDGAIIPLVNANNNPSKINRDCRIFLIYLNGASNFSVYEDDGKSSEYLQQKYAETTINADGPTSNKRGNAEIYIHKTVGIYKDMVKERSTVLQIMASENVENIKVLINGNNINCQRVETEEEFENNDNVYYFDENFIINPYLKVFGTDELHQKCLRIKIEKTNVTDSEIRIKLDGFSNEGKVLGSNTNIDDNIQAPKLLTPIDTDTTPTSITLKWEVNNAIYFEIERDGNAIFCNILGHKHKFKDFDYESKHGFRIRSVSEAGVSKWSNYIDIKTKEDPYKNIVEEVTVSCSEPCEHLLDPCNLIKPDRSFWYSDCYWTTWFICDSDMTEITLSCDLNEVYEIRKIAYIPREDAGDGTILKVQYRHSIDGTAWTDMSPVVSWEADDSIKVIELDDGVKFKYFEMVILDAILRSGSGRNILFYKIERKDE